MKTAFIQLARLVREVKTVEVVVDNDQDIDASSMAGVYADDEGEGFELDPDWGCDEGTHSLIKEEPEEEDCYDCRGTGIGNPHVEGSRCSSCGGSGVPRRERDSEPPSEPPESYRGP